MAYRGWAHHGGPGGEASGRAPRPVSRRRGLTRLPRRLPLGAGALDALRPRGPRVRAAPALPARTTYRGPLRWRCAV